MNYSIKALSDMAGVSPRTLRYYDEIGLLSPQRIKENGYRIYGEKEADLLQQILFYRELGVPLEEIRNIMSSKSFDAAKALQNHLAALKDKKAQTERLIENLEKTIAAAKGEILMNTKEKFEGFKKTLIEESETKFGKEAREKYGDEAIDTGNAKLMGLSEKQYTDMQDLSQKINDKLKTAFEQGDPAAALAQQVCAMHKEWLGYTWNSYSKEAHRGLAQLYVDDLRFKAYYDSISMGCAEFLRDAIDLFCESSTVL